MRVNDCRVLRKMDVRCSIFKLLLFQMLVAWCGAKHVTINLAKAGHEDQDVQNSIRNLIHTGELLCIFPLYVRKFSVGAPILKYSRGF